MDTQTRPDQDGSDDDRIDITDGPVGFASLKEPSDVEAATEALDPLPSIDLDDTAGSTDHPV
jgi:hypothetical protein